MPTDVLYIANAALGLCAQGHITSLDDGTPQAKQVLLHISPAIREVLEAGYFKCAKAQQTLTQRTAAPTYGWSYAYDLPADYLRMYRFNDIYIEDFTPEVFDRQGSILLCNDSTVKITYIKDLSAAFSDLGQMSPGVTDLCVVRLAQKMCWYFQQSKTLRDSFLQEYTVKLRSVKVTDALETRRPRKSPSSGSRWLTNRFSSTQSQYR